MKLIKIINQHRRDFTGLYECEGCRNQEEKSGYDDGNFHDNVTPRMVCKSCEQSRIDLGIEGEKVQTKYPAGMQV